MSDITLMCLSFIWSLWSFKDPLLSFCDKRFPLPLCCNYFSFDQSKLTITELRNKFWWSCISMEDINSALQCLVIIWFSFHISKLEMFKKRTNRIREDIKFQVSSFSKVNGSGHVLEKVCFKINFEMFTSFVKWQSVRAASQYLRQLWRLHKTVAFSSQL